MQTIYINAYPIGKVREKDFEEVKAILQKRPYIKDGVAKDGTYVILLEDSSKNPELKKQYQEMGQELLQNESLKRKTKNINRLIRDGELTYDNHNDELITDETETFYILDNSEDEDIVEKMEKKPIKIERGDGKMRDMLTENTGKPKVLWKESIKFSAEGMKPAIDEVFLLNTEVPIIFRGPPGTAKTFSLILWGMQNGYEVYMEECSSNSDYYDLVGTWILGENGETVFNATQLTSAFNSAEMGKKTLLILDEINLVPMDTLKSINSIFDRRKWIDTPIGRIYGNNNLIIAGTMNTEESIGNELDVAIKSKVIVIDVDAEKVLENMGQEKQIIQWIKTSGYKMSIRELEQITILTEIIESKGTERKKAAAKAMDYVLSKFDEETKRQIKEALKAVGG